MAGPTFTSTLSSLYLACVLFAGWTIHRTCQAGEQESPVRNLPPSTLDFYLEKYPPVLKKEGPVMPPLNLQDLPGFTPIRMEDLPDFKNDLEEKVTKTGKVHPCGLVTTINFKEYKERKLENEEKYVIPATLTGFKKEMAVRVYWQPCKAPLAVTLLGLSQSSDDKNARSWQHDLYKAGNHVISFDSIVRNDMNRITGHGVAGNPEAESIVVGQIIDSFLKLTEKQESTPFRDRVSSVRLLGASWGGVILMHCLRLPQASSWPLDRALAISIPVSLKTSSIRLDRFHREDQPQTALLKLAKLRGGFSPKNAHPTEEERLWMRGGLGYVFHGDLTSLAKDNVERYMPCLMDQLKKYEKSQEYKAPKETREREIKRQHDEEKKMLEGRKNQMDKQTFETLKKALEVKQGIEKEDAEIGLSDPGKWDFRHYLYLLARPFWQVKGDLSEMGDLNKLLTGAPNFVQVVITEDDPLNAPEDLEVLRANHKEPGLLVLPEGGHLAISGTVWFQALMQRFFHAE